MKTYLTLLAAACSLQGIIHAAGDTTADAYDPVVVTRTSDNLSQRLTYPDVISGQYNIQILNKDNDYIPHNLSPGTGITIDLIANTFAVNTALFDSAGAASAAQSFAIQRSNHTGTQAQSTITNLVSDLAGKEPAIAAGLSSQYYRGDKTWQTLPSAVNADWNSSSGASQILNKPTLGTAAAQNTSAFDAAGAASTAQAVAVATAASDATTKANNAQAAAIAASQPLDSDLTSIAAIPTTSIGRSLLAGADAAAIRTIIGAGTGNGTVTSVAAGTGLSGGTITATGTISMPNTGTAGTYGAVTTDAQGRVTAGKRMEVYSVTTGAAGTASVTFGTAYGAAPNIQINPTNFSSDNQFARVTAISATGFTVLCRLRTDIAGLLPTFGNINGATVDVLITEK